MSYFTGYVTREENDSNDSGSENESDSGSDDDFETAEFDLLPKSPRKLRTVVENMKEMELRNDRLVEKPGITRVRGQFDSLFSEPWWMVEVNLKADNKRWNSKKEKLTSSRPSYSYRTDDGAGEDVLSLFLTKGCKVHDQHVGSLLQFIRKNNLRPTLEDLMKNLEKFAYSNEESSSIAEQIQTSLQRERKFTCNCFEINIRSLNYRSKQQSITRRKLSVIFQPLCSTTFSGQRAYIWGVLINTLGLFWGGNWHFENPGGPLT